MIIDLQTVDHLAKLSRLEFDAPEKEQLLDELNKVLAFFDQLNQVDTAALEPMVHVNDGYSFVRNDKPLPGTPRELALQNAPQHDGEHFLVPKVIEKQ